MYQANNWRSQKPVATIVALASKAGYSAYTKVPFYF